jgi:hypothetical protein
MSTARNRIATIKVLVLVWLLFLAATLPRASAALGSAPWRAEYFDNSTLTGQPILERDESAINYDWQDRAPDASLPADDFSARWTAYLLFEPGTYTFKTYTDGGVGLWVDAQLLIGQMEASGAAQYERQVDLTAGYHVVRLEYRHSNGNATARLWWESRLGEGTASQGPADSAAEPAKAQPGTLLTTAPAPLALFNPNQVRRWGGPEESWYEHSHGYKGEVYHWFEDDCMQDPSLRW